MKFNGLCLLSVLLVSSLNVVSGHSCLNFEPMDGFEMEKFYGSWYAIKTTLPFTRCLAYDFYPQKVKKIKPITNYQFYYGELEANTSLPSDMTYSDSNQDYSNPEVKKPSFVVFDTNYESYASVFMCVKMPNGSGFKHYVTILSRSMVLDKEVLNNLIVDIFSVAVLKLSNVDHKNCNYGSLVEDSNDENIIDDDGKPYVSIKWIEDPTP
ncbi:bilin-binding protein-like [Adelges cooleyi]|uniref:bilin-binding protein-like n=1 Tax=Adelges cooleyi TaxID=133065 RepID=UPI0021803456|nr:bilin-binding protein-like [Adelges cooleyi]